LADKSHTLRNTIIGTVVGGLILSFVLWLVGFLPAVWAWLVNIFKTIWGWVTADLATPVWLLSMLIIFSLPVLWRIGLKTVSFIIPAKENEITSTSVNGEPVPQNIASQLSENELLVLRALAAEDGGSAHLDTIASRIRQNQLRTEQTLDSLLRKGLIHDSFNYIYDTSYYLSDRGRDLVIELGYA
jgi:hypothetical protein